MGIKRKVARKKADEAIRDMATRGFDDLCKYVDDLEHTWKSNDGSVQKLDQVRICTYLANYANKFTRRFRELCGRLDAHKSVFAIFPSNNSYASVLSGSLMLIIEAAVNHDEIANYLSTYVTHITEMAAQTADLLVLVQTRRMRELYSRLYAQVFLFCRKAMQWYMESRPARFFSSFNNKIKQGYEQVKDEIERIVTMMHRRAGIAQFGFIHVKFMNLERRHERLFPQPRQCANSGDFQDVGRHQRNLLLCGHKKSCIEFGTEPGGHGEIAHTPHEAAESAPAVSKVSFVNRAEARSLAPGLESFWAGTEGRLVRGNVRVWVSGCGRTFRGHWTDYELVWSKLWVSSVEAPQSGISSSRAAAMDMLAVAWEAKLPTVSHFCERPRTAVYGADRDVEKVGLIGMVYSLIAQLLQFHFDGDVVEVSQDVLHGLDGSDESWPAALDLFSALLSATPHLSMCVIDSLNDLAFGAGAQWCDAFLRVLFEHQKASAGVFRILLTTTGQSRVLQDHVKISDRVFTQTEAREVIRGGLWYMSPED